VSLALGPAVFVAEARRRQPTNGKHFMTKTQDMLADTGQRMGDTIGSVLGVQSALEEMQMDLGGEYSRWKEKSAAFDQQRKQMLRESQQLEKTLRDQKSMSEEKVRLEGELKFHENQGFVVSSASHERQTRRAIERQRLQAVVDGLESQLKASQVKSHEILAAEARAQALLWDRSRGLRQRIADLSLQVQQLQQELAAQSLTASRQESALLAEGQAQRERIRTTQKALVAQARLRAEQEEVAAQTRRVIAEREALKTAWSNCTGELRGLDEQIGSAKQRLEDDARELMVCQAVDADNQRLQGQLTKCKALQWAGR